MLTAAATTRADPTDFGYGPYKFNYDPSQEKAWREADLVLPAFPEGSQLVPVPMPASDTIKVSVDKSSLVRGTDGVLRFTLVIETPSGARSVFYDGIRCSTREYKTYAIGTLDRRFQTLGNAAWQFIAHVPLNGYRYTLYKQYACTAHDSARSPQEFLDALK
jgi:hypothetical protein